MAEPIYADRIYDCVVVGGGPAGATAAEDLARAGRAIALIDKAGRIKPCGGAIPPAAIREFAIPDHLLVAKITAARMVAPSETAVDMPIDGGFVGMVDRCQFDEYLRARAAEAGAERITGTVEALTRDAAGIATLLVVRKDDSQSTIKARAVIAADGARSPLVRQEIKGADKLPHVFAYHEILEKPDAATARAADYDDKRCDVYYQGRLSPDFYAWIFPHGHTLSIGTGSAHKGFSLRQSVREFREIAGLADCKILRREGAPIPMKPLKRWDNGRDLVAAGDAAGVVAPASGEGIYYALTGGRLAAESVDRFLATGDARALTHARKAFMRAHGRVFWVLGLLQYFWYANDKRRERFVSMCKDPDVQKLTWQAYMNKKLVRAKPAAHMRVFFKDVAHLFGMVAPR